MAQAIVGWVKGHAATCRQFIVVLDAFELFATDSQQQQQLFLYSLFDTACMAPINVLALSSRIVRCPCRLCSIC